ncbi:MAG: cold shock domain-containing protein [Ideonella sp.]|nr:cold shock domain-containing protein [Ideonella sp.]MBL0085201.1 cold shock domain-containing protein [Ideonella sp.]
MTLSGTLRTWNDERGFGFIAPTNGGRELFVHVSAFPRDGTRPTVGEILTYELRRGKDGKPQAVRVIRAAVGAKHPRPSRQRSTANRSLGLRGIVVALSLLIAASVFGYHQYQQYRIKQLLGTRPATGSAAESSQFVCDGRTYCSQMTSCAEAKYFLKNCPNTEMDGNKDGVPCEQQWCN